MRVITALVLMACLVSGCTSIVSSVVKEPINPDPTASTIGSDLNDLKMDTFIGVNIKKADERLADSHINVHVYDSVVLLTGEVPSQEMKTLAGDTARAYMGVRQVHNELAIRGNTSIVSRTNDSLITAQVKTKLAFDKEVESGDINVTTEDSVVYLMGKVRRLSAEKATEIASASSGVRQVVKVFEYVD